MKLNRELSQLHWLEDFLFYFPFFLRSYGAQAFLLPENGETERGVKTIDKLGVLPFLLPFFTSLSTSES